MATSGTVALTTIDSSMVIEHAFRRCRVKPALQTPENVATARESLYLLLLSLTNRGLNLWCIERNYVGCAAGQGTYASPAGTIDVLNAIYSQPTRITGTDTAPTALSTKTTLTTATSVVRIGVKMSAVTASDTLTLSASTDDATYVTLSTQTKTDWATSTWYWFDVAAAEAYTYFKAVFTTGPTATFSEFYLASAIYDLPMTQWNRDTFSVINNKTQQGRPSTSYYYEKLLTPQVTLWPVPNNNYDHITMFNHRQPQDVGTLAQQIEVPQRWVEGIIWQLAARLAFELDMVDPSMIPNIITMADKNLLEAESNETDGAPIVLQPNISVYNR